MKVVASVRRKTISALVYPAILLALSVVVVAIIVLQVVPAVRDFYNQFGKELPLSTRVIVAVSSSFATALLRAFVLLVGGDRRRASGRGSSGRASASGSIG